MTRRPHEIRIDHLVLPAGTVGRQRVRDAVERELARLAASGELNELSGAGEVRLNEIKVTARRGGDAISLATAVGAAAKAKSAP